MTTSPGGSGSGGDTASEGREHREPRLRLRFRSDDLARPFREAFDQHVAIVVDSVVKLDDESHLQYWTVMNTDAETLIETVGDFPTTLDARLLSTVDGTHRIEVHGSSKSLFAAFHAFGGVTRVARYDEDGVTVGAEFPPAVDTDAVIDAVHEVYPDLELVDSHTVETVDVFRRFVEAELTERQLTALRLAFHGGYYERPRQSTGTELAVRMGISKQAFHEHLRKAHATVFERLLRQGDQVDQSGTSFM